MQKSKFERIKGIGLLLLCPLSRGADGVMQVEALGTLLHYLQEGAEGVGEDMPALDLRIFVENTTPDTVTFVVEYGAEKPAVVYYNKPDREHDPAYLSFMKKRDKLTPARFIYGFTSLLELRDQKLAATTAN